MSAAQPRCCDILDGWLIFTPLFPSVIALTLRSLRISSLDSAFRVALGLDSCFGELQS